MPFVREVRVVLVHRERRTLLRRLDEHLRVVQLHVRTDQRRQHLDEPRVRDHSREDSFVVGQIVEALQLERTKLVFADVVATPCVVAVVRGAADVVEDAPDRVAHLLHLRRVEDAGDQHVAVFAVERRVVCHRGGSGRAADDERAGRAPRPCGRRSGRRAGAGAGSAARRPISNAGCATAVIAGLHHSPSRARRRMRRARRRVGIASSRRRSTCHACSREQVVRREDRRRPLVVEQRGDRAARVGRLRANSDDELPVLSGCPPRRAPLGSRAGGRRRSSTSCSATAARCAVWPSSEQVRDRVAGAALVVDQRPRRTTRSRAGGRPRRRGCRAPTSRSAAACDDRRHDHARRAHRRGTCARPASSSVRVAVVAEQEHLVVGLAQRLLDSRRERGVELVAEVRDDDADDAAAPLLQRPRRQVRDVAEAFGDGEQPLAHGGRDVAATAQRARRGRRRRAGLARDVGEGDRRAASRGVARRQACQARRTAA